MRPDTDFNGKDQAFARKNNGYTCNHRCGSWCGRII